MNCCTHTINGLDSVFNERYVRGDVQRYRKHGLDKQARRLADELARQGVQAATLLEVGCGIGGLLLGLLKAGASRAVGLDLSSPSLSAARELAANEGLADRVEYISTDISVDGDSVSPADVIILDRVVCCYPNMPELLGASAAHARRLLALTYPRPTWFMRAGRTILNLFSWLWREEYRLFLHSASGSGRPAASSPAPRPHLEYIHLSAGLNAGCRLSPSAP